ncbi:hypothetical protein E2C01_019773 [Portunus trituberculatus]|uniref:Uncharacterized protein n=1 Tax=Portunus trituberculatus TaxID=210409 RepID=A0A5B7DYV4_PORTR|nr:hypothetical protein [Portunus trituberculatus]
MSCFLYHSQVNNLEEQVRSSKGVGKERAAKKNPKLRDELSKRGKARNSNQEDMTRELDDVSISKKRFGKLPRKQERTSYKKQKILQRKTSRQKGKEFMTSKGPNWRGPAGRGESKSGSQSRDYVKETPKNSKSDRRESRKHKKTKKKVTPQREMDGKRKKDKRKRRKGNNWKTKEAKKVSKDGATVEIKRKGVKNKNGSKKIKKIKENKLRSGDVIGKKNKGKGKHKAEVMEDKKQRKNNTKKLKGKVRDRNGTKKRKTMRNKGDKARKNKKRRQGETKKNNKKGKGVRKANAGKGKKNIRKDKNVARRKKKNMARGKKYFKNVQKSKVRDSKKVRIPKGEDADEGDEGDRKNDKLGIENQEGKAKCRQVKKCTSNDAKCVSLGKCRTSVIAGKCSGAKCECCRSACSRATKPTCSLQGGVCKKKCRPNEEIVKKGCNKKKGRKCICCKSKDTTTSGCKAKKKCDKAGGTCKEACNETETELPRACKKKCRCCVPTDSTFKPTPPSPPTTALPLNSLFNTLLSLITDQNQLESILTEVKRLENELKNALAAAQAQSTVADINTVPSDIPAAGAILSTVQNAIVMNANSTELGTLIPELESATVSITGITSAIQSGHPNLRARVVVDQIFDPSIHFLWSISSYNCCKDLSIVEGKATGGQSIITIGIIVE